MQGGAERGRHASTSVFVVDDHQTFADLLMAAIDREPDLRCVGSAEGVEAAVAKVSLQVPDVVVMDYQLGDGDGITATARILARHPFIRVLILTAHANEGMITQAARAGACCLLPKSGSLPDLLRAVRTASPGGFMVHPGLLKLLVTSRPGPPPPTLSRRENEVLQLLASGLDVRSVAVRLGIGTSTCRGYVKAVLVKLDAHSQLEAVAAAHRWGLVRVGHQRPA